MTDIKRGDRVRITFEGEADEYLAGIAYGTHEAGDRNFEVCSTEGDTVTIEKINPPAKEFGLGDRIRHRDAGFQVTICKGGYLVHHSTGRHSWSSWSPTPGQFTSEYYDKVFIE